MDDVELVWEVGEGHPEGVVWDAPRRLVLFTESRANRILGYGADDGSHHTWQLPEPCLSFGLCKSGRLILALRRRLVFFDLERGKIEEFSDELDEPSTNQFNDGRPGPDGCYWVGTINLAFRHEESPEPSGSLYRVSSDGKLELKATGYVGSNGVAFSPDDRTVYLSDTAQHFVDAWDFDPKTGSVTNQRRFVDLSKDREGPDGAATDIDGCYWSACIGAGCLSQFSPTGELLARVPMPCPAPTMPCFVEDWLYVTSSAFDLKYIRVDLHDRPLNVSGLFRLAAPAIGAKVGLFADR